MTMLVDRIAEVLQAHRYAAFTGVCPCGFRFDIRESHEAHVAERVAAELQLDALHELLHYFSDSPQGWVGEGDEIASEALDVLHGEPVRGELRRAIAAAKAAGWTVAE